VKARKTGRIYKRSYRGPDGAMREVETWSIAYPDHGKWIVESTHSPKKNVAEAMLLDRIAKRVKGEPVGPNVEKTTLGELLKMVETDYVINERRTLRGIKRRIRMLTGFFGDDCRANRVTEDAIREYVRHRKQVDKAANGTINLELAALKRGFRLGQRAGRVVRRPWMELLQADNARKGFVEPDVLASILTNLSEDLQPVAAVAYLTGWRVRSEILTRTWPSVSFDGGWLRLDPGETKNKQGRMFPLTPTLRAVLERQRERTRALELAEGIVVPWVFHRAGKQILTWRKSWQSACRKAGVPGLIPHDFRRTAVRNLERAGVARSAAMKMVGHETESIYRRYAIVDEGMMREGARQLEALHEADRQALASRPKTPRVIEIATGSDRKDRS